jgi:outer membrane protein OmpA-like peptidoglycan-associated protein
MRKPVVLNYLSILYLFIGLSFACSAQQGLSSSSRKAIQYFETGKKAYEYKQNEDAFTELTKAVETDPSFFEAHLLLADVCSDLKKYPEAVTHYTVAMQLQPDRFPNAYYQFAGAEIQLNNFSSAKEHLIKMLSYSKVSPEMRKKAERRLANCRFAENAISHPVPFDPKNLGDAVNSEFSEYHPSLTVDEDLMVYTRMRPSDGETDNGGSKVEEDFYQTKRVDGIWQKSRALGPPINTHGNEGAHSISPDGRYFFFTGCNRAAGIGSCDLYYSERTGASWSDPVNMGDMINTSTWEAQPTISPDGRLLIFTSKREGGKGQSDLWYTEKTSSGRWSIPQNLGDSLNTELEESGPFIHPDGKTLYFSSTGHPGMGGKDIFYSKRKADGSWSKPVNIGYPINTKGEEMHLVVSANGLHGYFSSDRAGGFGQNDLYVFDLYETARPAPVTFLVGKVKDQKTGNGLNARFEIIDLLTGQTRAISNSDKQTGEFMVSLPTGSSYALNVSAPGYLFFSENYTLGNDLKPTDQFKVNIELKPINTGENSVLKNVFFESGSALLKRESTSELDKLVEFLNLNKTVTAEIGGHIDNVGNDQANVLLSEERSQSVVNYLVGKGVNAARLKSKGYGETKPVADNSTEEGRKLNRRTEFTVISK